MKKIIKRVVAATFGLVLFVGGFSISKSFSQIGQFFKATCCDGGDSCGWD